MLKVSSNDRRTVSSRTPMYPQGTPSPSAMRARRQDVVCHHSRRGLRAGRRRLDGHPGRPPPLHPAEYLGSLRLRLVSHGRDLALRHTVRVTGCGNRDDSRSTKAQRMSGRWSRSRRRSTHPANHHRRCAVSLASTHTNATPDFGNTHPSKAILAMGDGEASTERAILGCSALEIKSRTLTC
jgi:hypothetical protein